MGPSKLVLQEEMILKHSEKLSTGLGREVCRLNHNRSYCQGV
jgi:hypothetical protein